MTDPLGHAFSGTDVTGRAPVPEDGRAGLGLPLHRTELNCDWLQCGIQIRHEIYFIIPRPRPSATDHSLLLICTDFLV